MKLVDELGIINQRIAELQESASRMKAELIARGIGVYEGDEFVAEVQSYDRENISAPLVRKFADPEFVASVTTIQHINAVVVKPNAV